MSEELASVNALVFGRVQGVFFRASTLEMAQSLNLSGWVKNLADGSVEIEAEGPRQNLEDLLAWAKRGPAGAEVEDVRARWSAHRGQYRTFTIAR